MNQLASTIARVQISTQKWPIRGIRRSSRSPNRLQSTITDNVSSSALKSVASKVQVLKCYAINSLSISFLKFYFDILWFLTITNIRFILSIGFTFFVSVRVTSKI